MNIVLWIIQIVLALHTVMGAVWKFSNPVAQAVPSLAALSQPVWLALGVAELACSVLLVAPAVRRPMVRFVPAAALVIAAEMLLFTVVHLASGSQEHGQVAYWLVVAAICGVLARARRPSPSA